MDICRIRIRKKYVDPSDRDLQHCFVLVLTFKAVLPISFQKQNRATSISAKEEGERGNERMKQNEMTQVYTCLLYIYTSQNYIRKEPY